MPVNRIDAFRIDDPGRGAALFDLYKTHAPLPEVITSATTGGPSLEEPASPFRNQAEIIQAGPATILEQHAPGTVREMPSANIVTNTFAARLKPDHEPCFKASMPSCSWDHIHRIEIGRSQGRKVTFPGRGP